jgi:segregation and condensation protein B
MIRDLRAAQQRMPLRSPRLHMRMSDSDSLTDPSPQPPPSLAGKPVAGRFSLERLSTAFARLMGAPGGAASGNSAKPQIAVEPDAAIEDDNALPVTAKMIVEGLLFVGNGDGRAFSSSELAAQVRDLSPAEVDAIVAELNGRYREDDSAYEIVGTAAGYRLQLRADLDPIRDRVRGRIRAARLTPAAIETLSVIAYRPGVTAEEINRLRGSQSHAILAQLVRRQLVRLDRPAQRASGQYHTTERFNQLMGISSPADLPRSDELDDL